MPSKRGEEVKQKLNERLKEEKSEKEKADDWNREQIQLLYSKANYNVKNVTIDKIINAGKTLHDVEKLLKGGCPPRLVSKILV
jgi:hypothetical protein